MGLERRGVELADVVISPSAYLLRQYENYGWQLPAKTFTQPYPIFRNSAAADLDRRIPINELVFFGRLETRKGLWLFCEALERLAQHYPATKVTFLGRLTEFYEISTALQIINRSAKWPYRVRLLNDFDQEQALSYLREPGRLAVMPSIADNSPCVVYECMEFGIPFVTTRGSGADELVSPDCWDDLMVEPNVRSLTERLARTLENGARLGSPRFDPAANLATWSAWHRYISENHSKLVQESAPTQAPIKSAIGLENGKTALIAVIDNGLCSLSLLADNLSAHVKRFSRRAAYLILSVRRGELQEILLELFSGIPGSAPSLAVLDPRMIDEVRRIISASAIVFFVDAETELLTPFFLSASSILQREKRAVISCAVAVRQSREEDGEIEQLPTGDIPGLPALGSQIGGPAWAVSAANLAEEMSALKVYDEQTDMFVPSSVLGQLLMVRCQAAAVPIHVLPIVGAVETRERSQQRRWQSFNGAKLSATALGIAPSVHAGSTPWLAVAALGLHFDQPEPAPVACSEFLSSDHPLSLLEQHDKNSVYDSERLVSLAAALGRADLALQIEAGNGPQAGQTRHQVDVATRALRLRPSWDLADLLMRGRIAEFGRTPLPQKREPEKTAIPGHKPAPASKKPIQEAAARSRAPVQTNDLADLGVWAYIDVRRLTAVRNKIQAASSLRSGGPGRLYFFDVPLCGNSMLSAKLRSSSTSDPLFVRMKAVDQHIGEEMGCAATRLVPGRAAELAIPLHDVFGRSTVLLEFSGAEQMEVTIESMRVD
jgi:hypothetical protein